MLLFKLLVGFGIVLFWVFVITQIIIPIYKNKKMFPAFRKDKFKDTLVEANSVIEDLEKERVVKSTLKQVEQLKEEIQNEK